MRAPGAADSRDRLLIEALETAEMSGVSRWEAPDGRGVNPASTNLLQIFSCDFCSLALSSVFKTEDISFLIQLNN